MYVYDFMHVLNVSIWQMTSQIWPLHILCSHITSLLHKVTKYSEAWG